MSPQFDQPPARLLGQVAGKRVIVAGDVASHRDSSPDSSVW